MISRDQIQTVANAVTTVGQAKAILGAESEQLAVGYDVVNQIGGTDVIDSAYNSVTGIGKARQAARDVLDEANAYAQGIYVSLPKQADDWKLDDTWRRRVATALLTGLSAVNQVEQVASDLRPNYSGEYLSALQETLGVATGVLAQGVKNVFVPIANSIGFWPIAIGVGIVLLAVYISARGKAAVGV